MVIIEINEIMQTSAIHIEERQKQLFTCWTGNVIRRSMSVVPCVAEIVISEPDFSGVQAL
jgi:hypothetical protein